MSLASSLGRWRRNLVHLASGELVMRLPHNLVFRAVIRCWSNATSGEFGNCDPTTLTVSEALKKWEARTGGDPLFTKKENP